MTPLFFGRDRNDAVEGEDGTSDEAREERAARVLFERRARALGAPDDLPSFEAVLAGAARPVAPPARCAARVRFGRLARASGAALLAAGAAAAMTAVARAPAPIVADRIGPDSVVATSTKPRARNEEAKDALEAELEPSTCAMESEEPPRASLASRVLESVAPAAPVAVASYVATASYAGAACVDPEWGAEATCGRVPASVGP